MMVNSGEAMLPGLRAGLGVAVLPDFIVDEDIARGDLAPILEEWRPHGGALHLVMPPSRLRPARVEALLGFLAQRLTH
jgi:DNA-binding transcriptional LysR family regulator